MFQAVVPGSRTPDNGCAWRAYTTHNARTYEATSRRGAAMALARVLIAAGIPDQPVRLRDMHEIWPSRDEFGDEFYGPPAPYRGHVDYRSLAWMATRSWSESQQRFVAWHTPPANLRERSDTFPQKQG